MRCEICGVEPCATPSFCSLCREDERKRKAPTGIGFEDFYAYAPDHKYLFVPTGALWPMASVNSLLPWIGKQKPSIWLDQNRHIEQMTWAPGEDQLIKDRYMLQGGWSDHPSATVYNLYVPPILERGDRHAVQPWLDHVRTVYPDSAEHIIDWCAHRVQHPEIKINHALVLGGSEGIGKDTLLAPVRIALGHHNCENVSPQQMMGRFNGHLQCVLLVVSEARDLGEISRFAFYDHLKQIIAAPPPAILIDRKHTQPYYIPNLVGVVMTTNYKAGGFHLNPEDRRHYVAWSNKEKTDFAPSYWDQIWAFYEAGGYADVAAYLRSHNVAAFNPKAPPPITAAHQEIVNASRAPEEADFDDALEKLGWPTIVTLDDLTTFVNGVDPDFVKWLNDRKNRRVLPRRFESSGYVAVANPDSKQGLWKLNGRKTVAYARNNMTLTDQLAAVRARR
jgi:hypothetical protein